MYCKVCGLSFVGPEDGGSCPDCGAEYDYWDDEASLDGDPEAYLEEPRWETVSSTFISRVRYSYATRELEIEFQSGGVYSHPHVPESEGF